MPTLAKFYVHNEQSDIPVTSGGSTVPSGSAFMAAGTYIVNGISYDCSRQGLYRWWNPAGAFINRIVVGYGAGLDIYALVSAISWNHTHGTSTEYGDYQTISNAGRYRKWVMRCGYATGLINWLLPQITGPQSRLVNVATNGATNGFDDGHVVLETKHGADWRMWDITNGQYFRDANGKHISAAEMIAALANNGAMPAATRLDDDMRVSSDAASHASGTLDLALYWNLILNDAAQLEAWYRRMFQRIA